MRAGRRVAILAVASALLLGPGCAGRDAPWDVEAEDQARFRENSRVCRLLTDERGGELAPERFEKCMERRGWDRQCWIERLFDRD